MSDSEFTYDSDQNVSESHSNLVDAVAKLDKWQRVKKAERNEPTLEVSEFHLVKSGISDNDVVRVNDLAKVLGKKAHHQEITKRLESTKKRAKTLSKPLEKPAADRIKRIIGFENTKKELKKWNAVITKNRVAESLQFPLMQSSMQLEPSNQFIKRFRLQSDLEKELAELEPQKENVKEKKDEFSLTLKEVIMQRKDAAKLRAQQSYKEAKARRQNKIKSKKFHRIQKKEKMKSQLKEFEELQKTDPEAALEKLEQLDKSRAEERMSLRHKSTGQWAKNKQIRAKYDKETRQELAQQLSISRELTQKIKKVDESEDDNEEDNAPLHLSASDKENPWVGNVKTEKEIDDFVKDYRKYWDNQNKSPQNETNIKVMENSSKTANPIPHFDDIDRDAEPYILQCSKEMIVTPEYNQKSKNETPESEKKSEKGMEHVKTTSKTSNPNPNFEDIPRIMESTKIQTSKKQIGPSKFNSKNKKLVQNLHNQNKEEEKEVLLNESVSKLMAAEKNKLKRKTKLVATSAWNVQILDLESTNTLFDSKNFKGSNTDKLNAMFDKMEDKMQSQVDSKLQRIRQICDESRNIRTKGKNKKSIRNEDDFDGLEFQSKKQRPVLDIPLSEIANDDNLQPNNELNVLRNIEKNSIVEDASKTSKSEAEIDPNKYINVKPKQLHSSMPDIVTKGDEDLDDSEKEDEDGYNIVSEAFADDDVVDEFRKEKEDEVKKSQPKDIDLTLPGWGCWGGRNIRISNRKKKRFIMKFPKDAPRKDENKGNVIIIEESKPKIKEHQVTELPFPFTRVQDFEASVRMPLGRNFIPENAHRKLIEPALQTSMGKVIEPMSEDILVKTPAKNGRKSFVKKREGKIHKGKPSRRPKVIGPKRK